MREIQGQLADILGLYSTSSRVLFNSIVSFDGSINTKSGYKKFCSSLYEMGVTAEILRLKKREILNIFKPQNTATSSQTDDSTIKDQSQFPAIGDCPCAETSSILIDRNISTENKPNWNQFRFGWIRPPIDFLVGPLMLAAAKTGNNKRLVSILKYIRNINFEDHRKETALHEAAYAGYQNSVLLLLTKGASVEARNEDNHTSLHHAAKNGHTDTVKLLLGAGASIEAMDKDNLTPLHYAARNSHNSTVELLLTKGASIEAIDNDSGTPLHFAAQNGHTNVVEVLLGKGASIEARNIYNYTPLYLAARNGHTATSQERYFD